MSDDTPALASQLSPPRRRTWIIALAVPILLVALLICLQLAWRQAARHHLDATIDAIAATGAPIHFADLAVRDIPDDTNAAHFYLLALDRWPRLPDGKLITESDWYQNKDGPEWYEGDPAQRVDPITDNAAYLTQCAEAIDLLRRGAEAPDCSWPIELVGSPIQTNLPHLRQMRSLARLLDDGRMRRYFVECWISERWMTYNTALSIIEGRDDVDDSDQSLNPSGITSSFMDPVLMNDTELLGS